MMNFLASDFVSWLVRGPLQEPTHVYPQSPSIDAALRLPTFGPGSRLHWGFVIALLFAAVCAFGLRHLAIGFRLRLVGANPSAAWVTGGVRVAKVTATSFLISGALAGLAGGVEVTGVTFALYENLSPGFGYTAIAVALLAGLDPLWVVPSAIVFGALEAGGAAMQRDAGVPSGFVAVVEATIMLALLAGRVLFPGITRAPRSATVTSEASS
jgi:simple sugar transport system permease protein